MWILVYFKFVRSNKNVILQAIQQIFWTCAWVNKSKDEIQQDYLFNTIFHYTCDCYEITCICTVYFLLNIDQRFLEVKS
jgi:hypothetical protein